MRKLGEKPDQEFAKLDNAWAYSEIVDAKQRVYSAIEVRDQKVEHLQAHNHFLLTSKVPAQVIPSPTTQEPAGSRAVTLKNFEEFKALLK